MLSLQIWLLKALLVLPVFAFYLVGIALFVRAARESDPKAQLYGRCAGYASLATGIVYDIVHWTKPLANQMTEPLTRICMILAGLCLGMCIAAALQRRSS